MAITSSQASELRDHLATIEGVAAFDPTLVKGFVITVAMNNPAGGPRGDRTPGGPSLPTVFIDQTNPNFSALLAGYQAALGTKKTAAEQAVSDLGIATAVGVTVEPAPVQPVFVKQP